MFPKSFSDSVPQSLSDCVPQGLSEEYILTNLAATWVKGSQNGNKKTLSRFTSILQQGGLKTTEQSIFSFPNVSHPEQWMFKDPML